VTAGVRLLLLAVLLGGHVVLVRTGLAFGAFAELGPTLPWLALALLGAAAVGELWPCGRDATTALLAAGIAATLFGLHAAWLLGFAVAVVFGARLPSAWARLAIGLLAWSSWPAARALGLVSGSTLFGFLWASLLIPTLWLCREANAMPVGRLALGAYLVHPVRLLAPFWQPLRPSRFFAAAPAPPPGRAAAGRAFALGLFGLALAVAAQKLPALWPSVPRLLAPVAFVTHLYLLNAAWVTLGAGLLALWGHPVGSGFDWFLAARSLPDAVRRWNFHVVEAVRDLLFVPLATRLRRRMPLRLAYLVAGGVAIAAVGFVPSNVVIPVLSAPAAALPGVWRVVLSVDHGWFVGVWYLLMLLPAALEARRLPAWAQRTSFWIALAATAVAATELGVAGLWPYAR
jgi:hypothetical protein